MKKGMQMSKNIALLFVLGLFLLSPPAVSASQTEYTVVVQDYESFPPYSSYKNGEYGGFNRKLLDMFATSKGYTFKYVAYPIKRLFFEFVNGAGDLKYPDNAKWALKVKKDAPIVYSDSVVQYIDGVMVLPAKKGNGLDAMKNLGVAAGWTPWPYMGRLKSGDVKFLENTTYEGLLKQAIFSRNDGAYLNVAVSQYYLKNILKKPGALVFDEDLKHVRDGRSISSIKHPELIAEFNAFLKSHADKINALKQEYAVEDGIVAQ